MKEDLNRLLPDYIKFRIFIDKEVVGSSKLMKQDSPTQLDNAIAREGNAEIQIWLISESPVLQSILHQYDSLLLKAASPVLFEYFRGYLVPCEKKLFAMQKYFFPVILEVVGNDNQGGSSIFPQI